MNKIELLKLLENVPDDAKIEKNTVYDNELEIFESSPIAEAHYDEKTNKVLITPEMVYF